ncbi:unnamed protein product [Cercopithifilaria johnstoni]|uniref:Major sperm protein n=1 Tax=Cercopithifilaria johnstoni TaxID=2874296 RepID=A0A8J2MDP3_9BILA|nr:unnamed protein product [Cercopithifilaria johnstoni]
MPDVQLQEAIPKLLNKQSMKNIKKEKLEQQNTRIKDMSKLLSQQRALSSSSSCKWLEKKAIVDGESVLQGSIALLTNQRDHYPLLKINDLRVTGSKKSKFSHLEERMKQLITNNSNENEMNALMVNDIIVFPRQLKWKLINTVQRIQLQNPSENRFAIKVKCTDNDLYRVKPVFTFVEPKSSVVFDVNRHDGIATVDHILFLTTLAEGTGDDPRKFFVDSMTNNDNIIND